MAETTTAEAWVYQRLSGDTALAAVVGSRIYAGVAPEGAVMPLVVFQAQEGRDLTVINGARLWADMVWLVRCIDRADSFASVKAAADRIDAVLNRASGTVTDGVVYASVREQPFSMVEVENGIQYRHLGGLYRVLVK